MALSLSPKAFKRGIHPHDQKNWSKDKQVEPLSGLTEIIVPLLQHIGAPNNSIVKPRQEVQNGECIGVNDHFISAPVHASLSGTTAMTKMITLPNGRHVPSIPIKISDQNNLTETLWNEIKSSEFKDSHYDQFSENDIPDIVKNAGIVGMGGAAFPTHVKLRKNKNKQVRFIIINGCECEPYLTSDDRLMIEAPHSIISGAKLAKKSTGAEKIIIALENNKPKALQSLTNASKNEHDIEILPLETKYPMGGERQLVLTVTGQEIPTKGLPLDVGCVVLNCATSSSIAQAVINKRPLTHRIVCVTGKGIENPKNLFVPIGAPYKILIDSCGGLKQDAKRIISGGPMMGFTVSNLDTPVTKGTSGITILSEDDFDSHPQTNCVRCGRCVDVCPLHLVPTKIAHASHHNDWDLAKKYDLTACCECACCTYICPARVPLAQMIRRGKACLPKDG